MRAFAHDVFTYPLQAGHRFPLGEYRMVREAAAGLPDVDVHDTDAAVGRPPPDAYGGLGGARARRSARAAQQLGLGLPWSPELVERARHATGATILAARVALEDGVAANPRRRDAPRLCGRRPRLLRLQRRRHRPARDAAERRVDRVIVVDVDVHQGDGTHAARRGCARLPLSVNGFRNYPFRRVPGDLDVDLPDGTTDDHYLTAVDEALPRAVRRARPGSASSSRARTRSRATGSAALR